MTPTPNTPLLQVDDLVKHFPVRSGLFSRTVAWVKAVDGVSLTVHRGETLGLVGESGCGKTTLGRTVLRLEEPTSGRVTLDGTRVDTLPSAELRAMRARMQFMFQDPYGSLNPRWPVERIITEPLIVRGTKPDARRKRLKELLELVGLGMRHASRYPHEFSGGQRQRIGLARALALNPDLIICDEPVSALDVSIQAQMLNLLKELQSELGLAYLFIAHDLSVVRHISRRVAVMYLGKIVELAETEDLFGNARHPYTEALLSAVPVPDPNSKSHRIILKGDVPSPINPPAYCRFYERGCPKRMPICHQREPALIETTPRHTCACFAVNPPEDATPALMQREDQEPRDPDR